MVQIHLALQMRILPFFFFAYPYLQLIHTHESSLAVDSVVALFGGLQTFDENRYAWASYDSCFFKDNPPSQRTDYGSRVYDTCMRYFYCACCIEGCQRTRVHESKRKGSPLGKPRNSRMPCSLCTRRASVVRIEIRSPRVSAAIAKAIAIIFLWILPSSRQFPLTTEIWSSFSVGRRQDFAAFKHAPPQTGQLTHNDAVSRTAICFKPKNGHFPIGANLSPQNRIGARPPPPHAPPPRSLSDPRTFWLPRPCIIARWNGGPSVGIGGEDGPGWGPCADPGAYALIIRY